jgi:methylmalonyl-CoA mutase N-terminal domain/subunit
MMKSIICGQKNLEKELSQIKKGQKAAGVNNYKIEEEEDEPSDFSIQNISSVSQNNNRMKKPLKEQPNSIKKSKNDNLPQRQRSASRSKSRSRSPYRSSLSPVSIAKTHSPKPKQKPSGKIKKNSTITKNK